MLILCIGLLISLPCMAMELEKPSGGAVASASPAGVLAAQQPRSRGWVATWAERALFPGKMVDRLIGIPLPPISDIGEIQTEEAASGTPTLLGSALPDNASAYDCIRSLSAQDDALLEQFNELQPQKENVASQDNVTKLMRHTDKLALGLAAITWWWVRKKEPAQIWRRTQHRFPGGGLELAAIPTLIGPFLKPLLMWGGGAYLLYKLRQALAFPEMLALHKLKQKNKRAQLKQMFLEHQKKTNFALQKLSAECEKQREKDRKEIDALTQQLKTENKKLHEAIQQQNTIAAQEIAGKIEELMKQLGQLTETMQKDLGDVRDSVIVASITTGQLESRVEEAVGVLGGLKTQVATLAEGDKRLQHTTESIKQLLQRRDEQLKQLMQQQGRGAQLSPTPVSPLKDKDKGDRKSP